MATLSIITVHYHDEERLLSLLRSLPSHLAAIEAEVVVIDNGSSDGFARRVLDVAPDARYERNATNRGFAAAVNQGVRLSRGEFVCILNPDVTLESPFFAPLLERLRADAAVAAVGPAVFRPDGRRQRTAHKRFPTLGTVFFEYCLPLQVAVSRWLGWLHPHDESDAAHGRSHRTAHLTGVCLLVRRGEFLTSGGFDEQFFFSLEETDWQRGLPATGKAVWYCAESRCKHYGSIGKRFAQGSPHFLRGLFRYWQKWYGREQLRPLRAVIGAASLVSLITLVPLSLLAIVRPHHGPKVRAFFAGYVEAFRWVFKQDPTA
ncbi:MAG: glycosyltransferase [Candidatus Kerfeldbacteria bacterium]|nr:glycosyltransferase [Candidatus Kerfeldbacteria bacterium]